MGTNYKKIAISGATGFVGTRLSTVLQEIGHTVLPLKREYFTDNGWETLSNIIAQADVVINLAGAPINRRWTEKYKVELRESRIGVTQKLVKAINIHTHVQLLISASAVGFYPSSGCYDESHLTPAPTFLGKLCADWESAALETKPDVKVAITRFGVVLAPQGGAFELMRLPIRKGISILYGNGEQAFPWIDREDLVKAMSYIIDHPYLSGIFNFTTPQSITQKMFTTAVAQHYKVHRQISVPQLAFRALLGESSSFITQGQCVMPNRLLSAGYRFQTPNIEAFLQTLSE